jgi:hypothetical protein
MKFGDMLAEALMPWRSIRRIKHIERYAKHTEEYAAWLQTAVIGALNDISAARFENKFMTGQSLARLTPQKVSSIQEAEFHAFSQFGEDGIIQYLVRALAPNISKTFIEFGVQDYIESNTLFLMLNNSWRGLVLDGEAQYIEGIQKRDFGWKYHLRSRCAFVSPDNINTIFTAEGFGEELGLLSIDVDGIDWYLWEALTAVRPAIVISEYNRHFPIDRPVTIPYQPIFDRTAAHPSNRYYGTSLAALHHLAIKKGYTFVGVESHLRNAFFVRNDLAGAVPNEQLRAEFIGHETAESMKLLAGLPVFNVVTGKAEVI